MHTRALSWLLALLVAAAPACVVNATRPIPGPPPAPVVVTAFDSALMPYGDFIVVARVGRVWRPHLAVVGAGFVPYVTGGRWVLTSHGWVFENRWDFGWAVFHYGQWVELPEVGWVWVPGDEWAPAWVEWQTGGGYVAWAPMPPAGVVYDWRPRWCFIETRWMVEAVWIEHHVLPRHFHPVAPVVRIPRQPGRRVAVGPPPEYVRQSTSVPVRIHQATPPQGIGRTRIHEWVAPPPAVAPPAGQPVRPPPAAPSVSKPVPVPAPPARAPDSSRRVAPPPPAVKPAPPAQPAPPPGQPQKHPRTDRERDPQAYRYVLRGRASA